MFDAKFSYKIESPLKSSKSSSEGESKYFLYKVKTTTGRPYFIKVSYYENDVHFLKFYPKKLELSPNKYKIRVGNINELTRLVSTCIKLSIEIMKTNKNSILGFVGQWDFVDVEAEREVSQRYKIYEKAVLSVISKSNYDVSFIVAESINTFIVFPSHLNEDNVVEMMKEQFSKILGEKILDLFIPKKST
jgi:hypothetical protein